MAVGDAKVFGDNNIANDGTLNIDPGTDEWLIQIIESGQGKAMEIYATEDDGATFSLIFSTTGGPVQGVWRITNTYWLRLKNKSGGTAYMGYRGVQTK